jgi:hypothetical protein
MINEEAMQICTNIGVHEGGMENWVMDNAWVKFANIVEAHEREECAKVCEEMKEEYGKHACAYVIRARSKA